MTAMETIPGAVPLHSAACRACWHCRRHIGFTCSIQWCPVRLANTFRPIYLLLLNKYYFDELYDFLFVRPAFRLANLLWKTGDTTLIDGVPNGLAELTVDGSKGAVRMQTGSIAVYAFVMLIGLVVLVGVFLIWR